MRSEVEIKMITNASRILKLSAQYKNLPYDEELTKESNFAVIYRTNVFEKQTKTNFSLRKKLFP